MRKYLFVLATLMLTLAGCGSKQDSNAISYAKEQNGIMEQMMKAMEEIPASGSTELDFLRGMVPHHQSAVEMAKSYLAYANEDSPFRQLAEEIIIAQEQEIEEMNEMITLREDLGQRDSEGAENYLQEYHGMMNNHKHHAVSQESLDHAFAEGMIMHHQMAVDMAKAVIKYSKDKEILQFAGQIVEVQEDEIRQMKRFLEPQ